MDNWRNFPSISSLEFFLETIATLQAFRKRHADAQRIQGQLSSQPTTVDFSHYRTVLKNQEIVAQAEKLLKDFKPVTYEVDAQVKAIDQFEATAVSKQTLIAPSEYHCLLWGIF